MIDLRTKRVVAIIPDVPGVAPKKVHSLAVAHRIYTPEQEEDGRPVARMAVYEAVARRSNVSEKAARTASPAS